MKASPLAIEGQVLELLAAMSRRQVKIKGRIPPRWLRQAEEFLRVHFAEHLNLVMVSEAVGVHAFTWLANSASTMPALPATTFAAFALNMLPLKLGNPVLRLLRLLRPLVSLTRAIFPKFFRRLTGMTPAEYRAALSIR